MLCSQEAVQKGETQIRQTRLSAPGGNVVKKLGIFLPGQPHTHHQREIRDGTVHFRYSGEPRSGFLAGLGRDAPGDQRRNG